MILHGFPGFPCSWLPWVRGDPLREILRHTFDEAPAPVNNSGGFPEGNSSYLGKPKGGRRKVEPQLGLPSD
jgi:hypothetical protein